MCAAAIQFRFPLRQSSTSGQDARLLRPDRFGADPACPPKPWRRREPAAAGRKGRCFCIFNNLYTRFFTTIVFSIVSTLIRIPEMSTLVYSVDYALRGGGGYQVVRTGRIPDTLHQEDSRHCESMAGRLCRRYEIQRRPGDVRHRVEPSGLLGFLAQRRHVA
jgi:hypothetical protein